MEEVHLELFLLLSIGLTGQDLVDELKVRALHDIDYPTEIELYPVLCDIVLCLCALFVVLGSDHLQGPTAEQKVLDHIVIRDLGGFFEDAIEDQLDQLLEFHLKEFAAHLQHHFSDCLELPLTLDLNLHKLNRKNVTFSENLSD